MYYSLLWWRTQHALHWVQLSYYLIGEPAAVAWFFIMPIFAYVTINTVERLKADLQEFFPLVISTCCTVSERINEWALRFFCVMIMRCTNTCSDFVGGVPVPFRRRATLRFRQTQVVTWWLVDPSFSQQLEKLFIRCPGTLTSRPQKCTASSRRRRLRGRKTTGTASSKEFARVVDTRCLFAYECNVRHTRVHTYRHASTTNMATPF